MANKQGNFKAEYHGSLRKLKRKIMASILESLHFAIRYFVSIKFAASRPGLVDACPPNDSNVQIVGI